MIESLLKAGRSEGSDRESCMVDLYLNPLISTGPKF